MFQSTASFSDEASLASELPDIPSPFDSIITEDSQMKRIFRLAEKVSSSNSTVLILGESGTGKELIARAIHELSGAKGSFVPVNCGAIPDNLLESELFGYEKGAFTGATQSKLGRFVLADGGTIFLDEIGEMSPHLQVKLLRVLQDRSVEAVGGVKARKVQVRVIAATHVNLREKVERGEFREDLFYRLQVVPIELPPLRSRSKDVSLLAHSFSKRFTGEQGRNPLVFSPEVLAAFESYPWPGNIRELENLVERLSLLVDSDAVYLDDLPDHVTSGDSLIRGDFIRPNLPESGIDFNQVVEDFENSLIVEALKRTRGNKKAAAELLQLNRTTLVEKIKKKGLTEIRFDMAGVNGLS